MIVDEICKQVLGAKIRHKHKDEDPRDYRVRFDKIGNKLGFNITKTVVEWVGDVVTCINEGIFDNPDA